MFDQKHNRPAAAAGAGAFAVDRIDPLVLTDGNNHSSKFTTQQAQDFKDNWRVVSHQPNTATGFSATLFEYIGDPLKQPTASRYVVSFRSTEFIEDAVRDHQATNVQEVRKAGWAFGQISDMQAWWSSVQAELHGADVDVTGYSLGGHLATAFYKLHADRIDKVYTFNGAGVGDVDASTNLASVIGEFSQRRGKLANQDLFTAPSAGFGVRSRIYTPPHVPQTRPPG